MTLFKSPNEPVKWVKFELSFYIIFLMVIQNGNVPEILVIFSL